MRKIKVITKISLVLYIIILFSIIFSFFTLPYMPNNIELTINEFNEIQKVNNIYKIDKKTITSGTFSGDFDIKLFGLIKVKSVHVAFRNNEYVYAGGLPIGIEVTSSEVEDNITGIGTLTYVKDNMKFGALGHPITITKKRKILSINGGDIYYINKLNIERAYNGVVGRFAGDFIRDKIGIGKIYKNSLTGIYGVVVDKTVTDNLPRYELGSSYMIKPGKAKLLSSFSGKSKLYDIEIIKKINTKNITNKCMVIRITDKELLNSTGGIIQGMSGSPIIQDNKIVGAVTHVFVNDPTKGYCVYIDYMI